MGLPRFNLLVCVLEVVVWSWNLWLRESPGQIVGWVNSPILILEGADETTGRRHDDAEERDEKAGRRLKRPW